MNRSLFFTLCTLWATFLLPLKSGQEQIVFFRADVTNVSATLTNGPIQVGHEIYGQIFFPDCAPDTNEFNGIGDFLDAPTGAFLGCWNPNVPFLSNRNYHYNPYTPILQQGNSIYIEDNNQLTHTYLFTMYGLDVTTSNGLSKDINGYFPVKFQLRLYTEQVAPFWPNGDQLLLYEDFTNLNLDNLIDKDIILTFENEGQQATIRAEIVLLIGKGEQPFPDEDCGL